jgi:hypothetical protein
MFLHNSFSHNALEQNELFYRPVTSDFRLIAIRVCCPLLNLAKALTRPPKRAKRSASYSSTSAATLSVWATVKSSAFSRQSATSAFVDRQQVRLSLIIAIHRLYENLKTHRLRGRVVSTFNVCKLASFLAVLAPPFALSFLVVASVTELEQLLPGSFALASGQKNPHQGVYIGTEGRQNFAAGDGITYKCPTRLTVMPDGRSIFVSVQLPYAGVLNEVIEGSFNGNLFVGQSRGRFNGFNYILGFYYWIRFVGNQARMTCKPINPQFPGGDENVVFYRIRS